MALHIYCVVCLELHTRCAAVCLLLLHAVLQSAHLHRMQVQRCFLYQLAMVVSIDMLV